MPGKTTLELRKGGLSCMNSDQLVMRDERAIAEFGWGFDYKHMMNPYNFVPEVPVISYVHFL